MATVPLTTIVHHLRALTVEELSDSQLLERFAAAADEAAFATLVRRHGGLVLNVSGRILGAGPDRDDVFQATFLVLAQKAASIRKQASVASWLYGVAFRLAIRFKTQRQRRRRREVNLEPNVEGPTMPTEPGTQASLHELGSILDEELQHLPATCRDALVLCHLEGLSCSEAAGQLGWPVGTLKGRLLRGRDLLRKRLERRGITLSVAGLGLVLSTQAHAAVPAALVHTTLRCAVHKVISAPVAALAQTAARTPRAGRLKLALVALVLVGVVGVGAALGHLPAPCVTPELTPAALAAPQAKEPPVLKDLFDDPLPRGAVVRLGTVRWRHGAPVCFLSLLQDGKTLVSAANDRFVRVWDQATGKELRRFGPGPRPESGPSLLVSAGLNKMAVAVSRDGKWLATCFGEPEVQLWEIATGNKRTTIPLSQDFGNVGALAFAPDGKRLAMGRVNGPVRLWDFEAGKTVREFGKAPKEEVRFIAGRQSTAVFSPDGKALVSSFVEVDDMDVINHLQVWDLDSGKERFSVKAAGKFGIHSPVFSPDSRLLAYCTHEGQVCILRAADGTQLRQWKLLDQDAWPALAFSADSTRLYSRMQNPHELKEWDVKTGKMVRRLPSLVGSPLLFFFYMGPRDSLAVSPDGKTLAVGGGTNTIRFVDLASGKERPDAGGDSYSMLALGFTPDGQSAVTRSANGHYQIWDAATGKLQKRGPLPRQGYNFVIAPDGRYVAVWDTKHTIVLLDAADKEVATIPAGRLRWPIFFFGPDGKTLVVRRLDETVATLYDVPSGKERCRVDVGPGTAGPNAMVAVTYFFSPDGRRLAVYSKWGQPLTIHDTATGKVVQSIPLPRDLDNRQPYGAFSPDGRTIAIDYRDGLVQLIEVATGKVRRSFGKKFTPKGGWPRALEYPSVWPGAPGSTLVAFSPNGLLLAQVGVDNALLIWDVATGQSLARLDGHTGPIGTITFAPDGRRVATAGGDTTALIWDVQDLSAKAGVPPRALDAASVKARWADLASDDAAIAVNAIDALVAAPEQALPLLKQHLKPTPAADPMEIGRLIDQLDSEEFKVRQKAQADLLQIGEQAAPLLEKRLQGQVTLEMQKRLEELHGKLTSPHWTAERLQVARAIEVLERIGSSDARQLLQMLVAGAPDALTTVEARAALARR